MKTQVVHIIFLAHYWDMARHRYFLRSTIPHKVYFVRNTDLSKLTVPDSRESQDKMLNELKTQLPSWVIDRSEEVEMPFLSFEKAFPKLVSIMAAEKKEGNQVMIDLHGANLLVAMAATMAAALTGSQAYWIVPEGYETIEKGYFAPIGAKDMMPVDMPIPPALPTGAERDFLIYLYKNKGRVRGKLANMVSELGLDKLGANVKKPASGVVKLSRLITRLRREGLIETKRLSKRVFEVSLKPGRGKIMAEVAAHLEGEKDE